jgi:hypothetical protein
MVSLFLFLIIMETPKLLMRSSMILLAAALLFFCAPSKGQPILTTLVSPAPVTLRALNDSGLRDYANIVLDWELRANGIIRQKGSLANLPIAPKHPALLRLPIRMPSTPGEELFLGLRYHYNKKGRLLAEEQLPLRPWTGSQLQVRPSGELSYTDENGLFTVRSPAALVRFDKQTGWLQVYDIKEDHLLEDSPGLRSRFWLEPADPGYVASGAAGSPSWKEASQAPRLQLFSTSTGSQLVIVRAEYTLPETSCLLHLSYTINAAGEIQVEQSVEADSTHQGEPLPCFGMYWRLPAGFDSVATYGGALTPFREASAYATGSYTGVRWLSITRRDGKGIRFTADSTLLTVNTRSSINTRSSGNTPSSEQWITIDDPVCYRSYGNHRYAYKVAPVLPAETTKRGK